MTKPPDQIYEQTTLFKMLGGTLSHLVRRLLSGWGYSGSHGVQLTKAFPLDKSTHPFLPLLLPGAHQAGERDAHIA